MLHPAATKATSPKQNQGQSREPVLAPERELHPRSAGWTEPAPVTGILRRKCACGGPAGECSECQEKREEMLRRSAAGPAPGMAPPIVHRVLGSAGRTLDRATRNFLEPRFGRDFSQVRIHTDGEAGRSAQAVSAQAYTVRNHIVFGANRYSPHTPEGRKLLMHEVAHVVQQEGAGRESNGQLRVGAPDAAEERDADSMANLATSHGSRAAATAPVGARASGAPALRRTVVVDPPGSAGEILGMFNFLCSGSFTANGANISQSCSTTAGESCGCLCDVVSDTKRTYTVHVRDAVAGTQQATTVHSPNTPETVASASMFPHTTVLADPHIWMPSQASTAEFGFFDPAGKANWYPLWRILGHELCGHGRLSQTYAGGNGNRPQHDSTIDTENAIAGEHGDPARGHFTDPRQGESFLNKAGDRSKILFSQTDGLHFEAP
jgi:uncharacterized protein DUF4157